MINIPFSNKLTESNDTSVVDLGLHERRVVKIAVGHVRRGGEKDRSVYSRLCANFKGNTAVGGLGVVDSLSTSLDVAAHTVVVAGGEGVEVVGAVKGNRVIGSVEAKGSSIAGDLALGDVVRGLGTEEEAVTAENGVGSECGTLKEKRGDG